MHYGNKLAYPGGWIVGDWDGTHYSYTLAQYVQSNRRQT